MTNLDLEMPGFLKREPPLTQEYEIHPLALKFPPMAGDEFDALVEDIQVNKQLEPVRLFEGKILDGRNRYVACQKLGIEVWAEDYKGNDAAGYVISMNVARRHLTAEQKRDIIAELLLADPSKSDRQIAKIVKVDNKTVADVRQGMEQREEIPHASTRTDTRGRQQPAQRNGGGGQRRKRRTNPVDAAIAEDALAVLKPAWTAASQAERRLFERWKLDLEDEENDDENDEQEEEENGEGT